MNIPVLTTEQMVEVDRLMVEEYAITLIQMMENAGRDLALLAQRMLGGTVAGRRVRVYCGAGNNGGGGMVAARHLHNWGADVHLLLAADRDRLKDVPAHQLHILDAMGVPRVSADVLEADDLVVDALLGYGLVGNPRRRMAELIERVNQSSCPVLALDAPSGLDTTTGRPGTPCVQATATLTLALPKTGLLTMAGRAKAGDLYLGDISVPPGLYRQMGIDVPVLFPDGPLRKL